MTAFIALEPNVLEPGDRVPTPIYAGVGVGGTVVRIVDAGESICESMLETVKSEHMQVLIPTHMSSAFGDYAAGQVDEGHRRYRVALLVARLSQMVFGVISHDSLSALHRVAKQLARVPQADLCHMLHSRTLQNAQTWVKAHASCAVLMAVVVQDDSIYADRRDDLVFAALIHDLDGLIRGATDTKPSKNEQTITLSVLARHFPVSACVHEVLVHFRERADGSGSPFGYTAPHITRSAQLLGLLSTLAQDAQGAVTNPLMLFKAVHGELKQGFTQDVVDTVGASLSRHLSLSARQ